VAAVFFRLADFRFEAQRLATYVTFYASRVIFFEAASFLTQSGFPRAQNLCVMYQQLASSSPSDRIKATGNAREFELKGCCMKPPKAQANCWKGSFSARTYIYRVIIGSSKLGRRRMEPNPSGNGPIMVLQRFPFPPSRYPAPACRKLNSNLESFTK
jgi:hypothetical protein